MTKGVYGSKITTPIGRFSYPFVFEKAKSLEEGKEGKYEITLYIPKSEDITPLIAECERVAREAFGAKFQGLSKLKHPPIKDGDEKGPDDPAYNCWIVRAKTNDRPLVVGPDRKLVTSKEEIYGGAYGRLSVSPASYTMSISWGITLYLNAVQKAREGERFGGGSVRAEDVFQELAHAEPLTIEENF
jgi:hypothetical protein